VKVLPKYNIYLNVLICKNVNELISSHEAKDHK